MAKIHTRRSGLSPLSALALLASAWALAGWGCQAVTKPTGQTNIPATYNGSELTANLPAGTSVESVVAAVEAAFRDRGYSVDKSSATEQAGQVVARPPRTGDIPYILVRVRATEEHTRVIISKEPFGGEEGLCRGVLSRALAKLGL